MPMQDAARSMLPDATTPASAGVSPPPQDTSQTSQAACQPRTRSSMRATSENQSLPPAAQ